MISHAASTAKSLDLRLGLEPCNRRDAPLNTGQQTVEALNRIGADNTFGSPTHEHRGSQYVPGCRCWQSAGIYSPFESNRGFQERCLKWEDTFAGLKAIDFRGRWPWKFHLCRWWHCRGSGALASCDWSTGRHPQGRDSFPNWTSQGRWHSNQLKFLPLLCPSPLGQAHLTLTKPPKNY